MVGNPLREKVSLGAKKAVMLIEPLRLLVFLIVCTVIGREVPLPSNLILEVSMHSTRFSQSAPRMRLIYKLCRVVAHTKMRVHDHTIKIFSPSYTKSVELETPHLI